MALEPSLWGTLPEELLHLVFVHLSIVGIVQLRVLSKEWKWNIDYKHSEFNRVFDATTHFKEFAMMTWNNFGWGFWRLYDLQADIRHDINITDFCPHPKAFVADGGLFYCSSHLVTVVSHFEIIVVNPLTKKKKKLPLLLHMGSGNSDVWMRILQLTMDKKTTEYKVYFVGNYMKFGGNILTKAQVYDSHINAWSMVESREGRIIGEHYLNMYNCADGNLQQFYLNVIAPGYTKFYKGYALINDHLFVLHRDNISQKYCILKFHLLEKTTAWVKLAVHDCDPSIYKHLKKDYYISLLACNGFLLVHSSRRIAFDRVWLYDLSTCVWRDMIFPVTKYQMLHEINWSALP